MKFPLSIFSLLVLVAGSGCLSTSRPAVCSWTIDEGDLAVESRPRLEGAPSLFSATRLGAVTVCAPFDRTSFVVRRSDGSLPEDPLNVFAAAPSSLVRAAIRSQLVADGRFGHVLPSASVVSVDASVEVLVKELSLDCREQGRRRARVSLVVGVVKIGRTRELVLEGEGEGLADAQDGNYSSAFTQAFNIALREALRSLK